LAAALSAAGVTIDKRKLALEQPVKQLGFHSVPIRLHPEVTAEIRLTVEPE
jgi:large subunit ribosomal protein L9